MVSFPLRTLAGGAYDSHHRTAGVAGGTWRCGGRVAARGAGAAAGDGVENFSRGRQLSRPTLRIQMDMQGGLGDCGREHLAIMASMSASALLARNPHPA